LVRAILGGNFGIVELLGAKLVVAFNNLRGEVLSKPMRRVSIDLLVKIVPMNMNISGTNVVRQV